MRFVYICSPYRAADEETLQRNIDYARELTREILLQGEAAVTPHLYMTQCLNEDKPQERAAGMAAGLALLKKCDFVIAGVKYGISEGMSREIQTADVLGIEVVNADKLRYYMECKERQRQAAIKQYADLHACDFCKGRHFDTCTLFCCKEPYRQAYEYAETHFSKGEIRQ